MNKYTLMCKEGYMFRSAEHYLILGEWVGYTPGYVILQHGSLSDQEHHQISGQTFVNVYQDQKSNSMSIIPSYSDKYLSRHPDLQSLCGYAGCLKRESQRVFVGRIHVK